MTRKEIIFREAARLFREKGYSGSTLRNLADRAGIKGGSIYHHFGSKQEILFAIMAKTMTELLENIRKIMSDDSGSLTRLHKVVDCHIRYHTSNRDETYVTDAELRSLEPDNFRTIVTMRDQYEETVRKILREGNDSGTMNISDIDTASRALLQMCTGISYWFNPAGRQSIDEIVHNYLELFLWGVRGRARTEKP